MNLDKSAFPTGHIADFGFTDYEPGMTLREWLWTQFAAAAITGLIPVNRSPDDVRAMPNAACLIADAMMAAIEARGKDDV